ncbi:hypothetical protein HYX16_05335 [Candidatus Woesearchaeota archaeon]|nr:hypothetical protein [Candidatus Woesearchaeota archaeon]
MADNESGEQEKYYKARREALEEERFEKKQKEAKEKLEKLREWDKEEEKKSKETHAKSFKGRFSSGLSSVLNSVGEDIKSGDLKRIFLIPFALPFKLIGLILNLKYFWLAFIILIAVLGWFFIFNLVTGGGIGFLGTETSVLGSRIGGPLSVVYNQVSNFVSDPVGTIASFGEFKNPNVVEETKPQGIEFRKLETRRAIHRSGKDPIEVIANVKIYSLQTPSQVEFSCFMDDALQDLAATAAGKTAGLGLSAASPGASALFPLVEEKVTGKLSSFTQGQIEIFGQSDENKIIEVLPEQDKSLNFLCKFDPITLSGITTKRTTSQKITLNADFKDFITRSRLKIYTLDKDKLENLEKDNVNPFIYFKISDPLLSSDRSVRPEQLIDSPGVLSLSLIDAQPLTEGPSYLLGANLFNDKLRWNGKLTKLKSLKIFFPAGFTPNMDGCKEFILSENTLVLKPEFMQVTDKSVLEALDNPVVAVASPGASKFLRTTSDEINNLKLFCDFKVDSSVANQDLSFSLINAEAVYDYQFQAFTSAIISQNLLTSSIES